MTNSNGDGVFDHLFETSPTDFLRSSDGVKSRAAVLEQAGRVASQLQGSNLESGARVAVLCTSPSDAIVGLLAVMMTPYCAVPLHPASPAAALQHIIADSGAQAIVSDRADSDLNALGIDLVSVNVSDVPPETPISGQGVAPDADSLAAILYTSGTTGRPKGVTITYANIDSMAEQLVDDFFRVDETDTLLMAAPITNIFGVALVSVALRSGAALSVPSDLRPANLLETLTRDRVSFVAGVPMIGALLMRATQGMDDPLPHLRRVLFAGTKLEPALARGFAQTFNAEVMTGYAMTEGVPISMALDALAEPDGSVGTIARDVEVKVVNSDMEAEATGEKGEILVRGAAISPGYWQAPALNEQSFHEGWFRTGDVGMLDENGHLILVDRIKEIIKSAGNTIYPSEVETVLRGHPNVRDVAVVGMPNESVGEVIHAFLVPNEGQSIDPIDLKAFCSDKLNSWKVPRRFTSMEALPMTPSGKVSKVSLRSAQKVAS